MREVRYFATDDRDFRKLKPRLKEIQRNADGVVYMDTDGSMVMNVPVPPHPNKIRLRERARQAAPAVVGFLVGLVTGIPLPW